MERLLEGTIINNNIVAASRGAGTVNGSGVDTSAYRPREVAALVNLGAIAATGTLDVKLQESDDNSTWADIAGAAITQLGASDDNKHASISVRWGGRAGGTRKKYVRAVGVVANATTDYGVQILLVDCEQQPVVNAPASVLVA